MVSCSGSAVLVLLLLGCLWSDVLANNAKGPDKCCFKFFKGPIHKSSIWAYEETRDGCPKAGIIFTTVKRLRLCVNPGTKWVRRVMDAVDKRLVESST